MDTFNFLDNCDSLEDSDSFPVTSFRIRRRERKI